MDMLDILSEIDEVAPCKSEELSLDQIYANLLVSAPQLVTETKQYAMTGYTMQAIASATSLGIKAIEAILAQQVPEEIDTRFRDSQSKHGLAPLNRVATYADIRSSISASRKKKQVQLADKTTQLRTVAVERALELMNAGYGNTLRDVVGVLRVLGVPAAGSVTETPADHVHTKVPPRFIVDGDGRYAPNPEYAAYVIGGRGAGEAGNTAVTLNISMDTYNAAGSKGIGSVIDTDAEGNIISVTRDGETRSLQSMSASEMHKLASGSTTGSAARDRLGTKLDKIMGDSNASAGRGVGLRDSV